MTEPTDPSDVTPFHRDQIIAACLEADAELTVVIQRIMQRGLLADLTNVVQLVVAQGAVRRARRYAVCHHPHREDKPCEQA